MLKQQSFSLDLQSLVLLSKLSHYVTFIVEENNHINEYFSVQCMDKRFTRLRMNGVQINSASNNLNPFSSYIGDTVRLNNSNRNNSVRITIDESNDHRTVTYTELERIYNTHRTVSSFTLRLHNSHHYIGTFFSILREHRRHYQSGIVHVVKIEDDRYNAYVSGDLATIYGDYMIVEYEIINKIGITTEDMKLNDEIAFTMVIDNL